MKKLVVSVVLILCFTFSLFAQRIHKTLQGHTNLVSSIQFSLNGKVLLTGSWDKTLRIWSSITGETNKIIEAGSTTVFSAALSPDMKYAVAANWSPTVTLYSTTTGDKQKSFMAHPSKVDFLTYSPDGKTILTAGNDTIKLWDASSLAFKRCLAGTVGDIQMVAFSPDGKTIASNSNIGNIKIWNVTTGELIKTLYAHINNSPAVAFSRDGKYLVSLGEEGTVKIWDAKTYSLINTFTRIVPGANYMDICSDSRTLALAGKDGNVYLFDILEKKIVANMKGHAKPVTQVAFSPDGSMLASASMDYKIILWDITDVKYRDCIAEKMLAHKNLIAPKGEFETTEQYNKRLGEYEKLKMDNKRICIKEAEVAFIEQQAVQVENVLQSYSYVKLNISNLSSYNADKQTYDVTIDGKLYLLKMPIADAKSFKDVWKTALVKGIQRANPGTKKMEYINLQVVHPLTNVGFPIGSQVSPATDKSLKEFMDANPEPKG